MDAPYRSSAMREDWLDFARARPVESAAIAIAVGALATILGAWFFQYALGLKPCPMCLEERYPYYFAIPLAILIALGAQVGSQRKVLVGGLFAIAAFMLWNAGLGGYHAGVEWKLWAGPTECSGPLDSLGGSLMDQLKSISVVRCDEAAWRFLGISLAGYNALIALALAAIAIWGGVRGLAMPDPER